MGTTADKLNKLLETKAAIKSAIVSKGVEVADGTKFADYPSKIAAITSGGSSEPGEADTYYENLFNQRIGNGTNMYYLFANSPSSELDVSRLDTSKATLMNSMFYYCYNLTSLNLSHFNTGNVTNMNSMFSECSSLTTVGDVSSWNVSKVTDMQSLFYNCKKLESLGVTNWNVGNVTDMKWLFYGCEKLSSLNLSSWNTSNVSNMKSMFCNCYKLTQLDLSNWNTNKVTDMSYMFENCQLLTSVGDLSDWDTSNVTNMAEMFCWCYELTSLDASNWNTSKVTNMEYMFYGCNKLTELNLSNFDTSKVTSMSSMFYNCTSLHTVRLDNCSADTVSDIISKLPTGTISGVTRTIYCTESAANGLTAPSGWVFNFLESPYYIEYTVDTSSAVALDGGSSSYKYGLPEIHKANGGSSFTGYEDIEITLLDGTTTTDVTTTCDQVAKVKLWYPADTKAVKFYGSSSYKPLVKTVDYCKTDNFTDMSYMFYYCQSLVSVNSSDWNISNVTSMYRMFYYCGNKLKTLDVTNWNTSKVTNMAYMFFYCPYLNTLDVSRWDTSNVTNMTYMFTYDYYVTSIGDLSNWDTSKVTDMEYMFRDCRYITGLNLSNWNTSKVKLMSYMFYDCYKLTELDLSNFDTSSMTSIGSMFTGCTSLHTLKLDNCSNDTISDIITTLPTDAISGKTRTIYCTREAASGLTAPTNWVFSFAGEDSGDEPEENTSPYYVEYTVDNTSTYPLNGGPNSSYRCGMPRIGVYQEGKGAFYQYSYTAIEITLLDGTITTDITVPCSQVAKVKMWYPENYSTISFNGTSEVKTVGYCNTSNFTYMAYMFSGCNKLTSLDASNWDISNVLYMNYMFSGCTELVDFIAPNNISVAVDFSPCTKLTHDSLMSIINNLATVTTTKTLTLGSTNLAKLSDNEKAIATNKGWTLA